MAATHDPLRGTLDTMQVDPDAGSERPYLVSMLRRLGYSESEIREIIRDHQVPATGEPARDIEIEYTGAGLRDYLRVLPPESPGFDLNRPGELVEFGTPDTQFQVVEPAEPAEEMLEFAPYEEETVEFAVPVEETPAAEAWDPDAAPGEGETLAAAEQQPEWEPVPEQAQPAEGAYQHGEWTLYRREGGRPDSSSTPVYFFAKDQPKTGEPSPMPDGYEVGVNERTGLPFLRRSKDLPSEVFEVDPSELPQAARLGVERIAGRRRVRVLRVRARSREEAERMLASPDRQVLGSVPINIEENWDQ